MYFIEVVNDIIPSVRELFKQIVRTFYTKQIVGVKVTAININDYYIHAAKGLVLAVDEEGNFVTYVLHYSPDSYDQSSISIVESYEYEQFERAKDVEDVLREKELIFDKPFKLLIAKQTSIIVDGERYEF